METPSSNTSPEEGSSNPAIIFSAVVFPQPDGPSIATSSPDMICASISWITGGSDLEYCFIYPRQFHLEYPHEIRQERAKNTVIQGMGVHADI